MTHPQLRIITGGPGSGKTTLLSELNQRGLVSMPEAGRAIIQDQLLIGGSALPWTNPAAFAELMLSWELRSYRMGQSLTGSVLFDRGIPDVMGYLQLSGLPVPDHVRQAARLCRYHRQVFIAPPWLKIYEQDTERKQSFAEAEATYQAMLKTYTNLDYELVHLPLDTPNKRADFIQSHLK